MRITGDLKSMLNKKVILSALLTAAIGAVNIPAASAAVSAEEAEQLGTTLTKFGAIKAGNEDGSIPEYTGGLTDTTFGVMEDPFADEKPLYVITSANMAEYDDLLTPATKELLSRHSEHRVDVYPTHRTANYPDWVLENTLKNATTATHGGPVTGDNLIGDHDNGLPYPGVPFPIPKDGYEVMWNNTAKYSPPLVQIFWSGYLVDTAGKISNLPHLDGHYVHPQYDRTGSVQKVTPKGTLFGFNATLTDPPSSAGIVFLNFYTAFGEDGGQKVWFYTPGQRRVRMAPEFAYDVPIASYGGATIWDEIYGFVGRMDRFEFKLVGLREMIVPYNTYKMTSDAPTDAILGPKTISPDYMRWEKHRVWVVDAVRKPDARHVYSRRTFYIDEDSWGILVHEAYDDSGQLYRATRTLTNAYPGSAGGGQHHIGWGTYDLIKGNYFVLGMLNTKGDGVYIYQSLKEHKAALTPSSVQSGGVRGSDLPDSGWYTNVYQPQLPPIRKFLG